MQFDCIIRCHFYDKDGTYVTLSIEWSTYAVPPYVTVVSLAVTLAFTRWGSLFLA